MKKRFISEKDHHYFALDAEVIFEVCQNKIPALKHAICDLKSQF